MIPCCWAAFRLARGSGRVVLFLSAGKVPDEKSLRANLQSFLSDLADAESGHIDLNRPHRNPIRFLRTTRGGG
jgi:hypothetical protein